MDIELSKVAVSAAHGENSPYFAGWKAYDENPYDELHNPSGIIQMGLAENQVSFDMVEEYLEQHSEECLWGKNKASCFKENALFQDYHGLLSFRKAMASFMEQIRSGKAKFNPERIVITAGATAANELLTFILADPGDALLVPTPYYPGFDRDLQWRTGVKIVPIQCESSNGFQITPQAMEAAYQSAQSMNIKVRGVLITNPSNPLGVTISRSTLEEVMDFVTKKNIHLISDEIYSGSVFSPPDFVSVGEILKAREYHKEAERVHIVYSLSKDLGLPGFRVGTIYSYNDRVVTTARRMSSFTLISSQTQHSLACMLSDAGFTENYIRVNRDRLLKRRRMMVNGLKEAGIECLEGNAGLFCWMNLSPFLEEPTRESELVLWDSIVNEARLNVSPGSSCHCMEPGWFRVCFANMSENTLEVALERIRDFMDKRRANKSRWFSSYLVHGRPSSGSKPLILEILNRLNNTTDLARCRVASKSLDSIAAEVRSINLQCSFDRYTKSRLSATASQVTPFKEIFLTLISNSRQHVVESVTIGVEKPLRGISFDDDEVELDDLYLTCVDFVMEWLPVHGGQMRSLSISDFWIQSCWRRSHVLSLISSFCHHLEELELKNTWLSMEGMNKMHNLTSLTLEFIRLDDEDLSKLNDCFPSLQVLILNEVGGLNEPMIHLLHLTTCQWRVSNAPLSLSISAPKLVNFKLNCVRPNKLLIDAPLLLDFSITISNTNQLIVKELPNLRSLKIESANLGSRLISIFPFGKTVNNLSLESSSKEFSLMSVMDAFPNVRSLTIGPQAWSEAEIQVHHAKGRKADNGSSIIKGLKQITAHLVLAEVELTLALIFDLLGRCSDLSDMTLLVPPTVDSTISSNLMAKCLACNAHVRWRLGNW